MLTKFVCFILVLAFIGKGQLQWSDIITFGNLFEDLFEEGAQPNITAVVETVVENPDPNFTVAVVELLFDAATDRISAIMEAGIIRVGDGQSPIPIRKLTLNSKLATTDQSGYMGRRRLFEDLFSFFSQLRRAESIADMFENTPIVPPDTAESIVEEAVESLVAIVTDVEERVNQVAAQAETVRDNFFMGMASVADLGEAIQVGVNGILFGDNRLNEVVALQEETIGRLESL